MKYSELTIKGLLLIEPNIFSDSRGLFFELYKQTEFVKNNIPIGYVQDNVSVSKKDVIRGLHFQVEPHAQGKLVSVIKGAVLDVVVDVRKDSPTFGKYEAVELNDKNKRMLWIPEGFAHGFAALEENTCFLYKCTNYYHKQSEMGIRYDDADLNISCGIKNPIVSEKDMALMSMRQYKTLEMI